MEQECVGQEVQWDDGDSMHHERRNRESRLLWKLGDGEWWVSSHTHKRRRKIRYIWKSSLLGSKDLGRQKDADSFLWLVTEQRVSDSRNSVRGSALNHHFKTFCWIEKPWIRATMHLLGRNRNAEGCEWNITIKINPKDSNTFHTKWAYKVNITKYKKKANDLKYNFHTD